MNRYPTLTAIARMACLLTLAGYALRHFAWDGRLISQIYSEAAIRFFAGLAGVEWKGFFLEGAVNPAYRAFIYGCGSLFALGALLTVSPVPVCRKMLRPVYVVIYWAAAALILFTAVAGTIESKLHLNVLIEYSIKIAVSLLFLHYALGRSANSVRHVRLFKWIIALTFIGHGLYALNIFPVPDNFLMMTSNILRTGSGGSIAFLAAAGALDIVASALLFLKRTERVALAYMMLWGLLTALARLVAYCGTAPLDTYLALWLPEFLVRSGHYLLPLYLLVYLGKETGSGKP